MRSFFIFSISVLLLFTSLTVPVQAESDQYLESVDFNLEIDSDEQFVRPFEGTLQTLNTAFGTMDGKTVSYTVATGAGSLPAIFNVVDLETGELMYYETMEGAIRAWSLLTDDAGNVYIGASGKVAQLWKFDPNTKELEKLGEPIANKDTLFTLTTDGRRVYGGGYPTGRAFEYDPDSNKFTDLGVIDEGKREALIEDVGPESYIRSSATYRDHVYFGSGSKNGRIIKMNISSGKYEKELIEMPVTEENKEYYSNMQFVYDLRVVDHYLFAFFNGPFSIHVYDLDSEEWLDTTIDNVRGLVGASTEYQDHIYVSSKDKNMYRFSLQTLELDPEPYHVFDANLRNTEVLEIDGKEQMVSIHFNGSYFFMDFTGDQPVIKNEVSPAIGQSINVHSLHIDDATQKLFASGFMGTELFEADLNKATHDKFKLGQLEGMASDGEYVYFGEYPAAQIFRYSLDGEGEVEELFTLRSHGQDRPFRMVVSQDKLFVGTIADYGKLQGALTIYDLQDGELKVYDDLAKNQGIVGIAVKDDYVYLSTTTRGGIGSIPSQKTASILKFNWKTETVEAVKTYEEELPGQQVPMISGLIFDEEERLWAFANGTIFQISTEDLSMVSMKEMYEDIDNFGSWRPVHAYVHDGLIYANPGFNITAIHPETLDFKYLARSSVFSMDDSGSIYYIAGVDIKKLIFNLDFMENWVTIEDPDDEKPVDEKPDDEKPADEKPVDEKPDDEKPVGDKPVGDKPVGDKPVGDKPVGDKPVEEKPVEDKPVGDKPVEEKPGSEELIGVDQNGGETMVKPDDNKDGSVLPSTGVSSVYPTSFMLFGLGYLIYRKRH